MITPWVLSNLKCLPETSVLLPPDQLDQSLNTPDLIGDFRLEGGWHTDRHLPGDEVVRKDVQSVPVGQGAYGGRSCPPNALHQPEPVVAGEPKADPDPAHLDQVQPSAPSARTADGLFSPTPGRV